MNSLKKIDHYLLTNHPILWRTKVHYFVLLSFILGNVLAFGLGYFSIKWFGAIDLDFMPVMIWGLNIFVILLWLMTQARNKIKHYRFWDEVLTYSIYVICTAFLFLNLSVFERTLTHTTANLVSVEQIDIDKGIIDNQYTTPTLVYPSYGVVLGWAKRYQLSSSFNEKDIPFVMDKISDRVNRIYWNQPRVADEEFLALVNVPPLVDSYMLAILFFLFVPMILFLISHVHFRMILSTAAIFCCVVAVSVILGILTLGGFPAVLYVLLCGIVVHGKGKINRFVTLLIIPYTLMGSFLLMTLLMDVMEIMYHNEVPSLKLSLIFTSIITIFSSAFFIKKHFEPNT